MRLWAWLRALWFRWIGPRPVLMVANDKPLPIADQIHAAHTADHVPETVPMSSVIEHRYRVVRQFKGITYQTYAGTDGVKALEAWEAYKASALRGTFWFLDTHHDTGYRGQFRR